MRKFILLVLLLALIYRDSFFAPFFQDDFLLLNLAKSGDVFSPIANFPYRPISIQLFYGLGLFLFGNNPIGYHLLQFGFLVVGLFAAYRLASIILKNEFGGFVAVAIYAFNVSLFPLFYWIATSYFTFLIFFVFLALWAVALKKYLFAFIFFILGLLSNEIMTVFPVFLLLVNFVCGQNDFKTAGIYLLVSVGSFFIRGSFIGIPQNEAYKLDFSPFKFLATIKWYLIRVLNLPEGRAAITFVNYILVGVLALITFFRRFSFENKYLLFAIIWFFAGAIPFFFLPNHMSAYYLSISLFGPAVLFGKMFQSSRTLVWGFLVIYILLTIQGLKGLETTHWIITKPSLLK